MPDLKQMIKDVLAELGIEKIDEKVEHRIQSKLCRQFAAMLNAYADSLGADDSAKKPPEPPDR